MTETPEVTQDVYDSLGVEPVTPRNPHPRPKSPPPRQKQSQGRDKRSERGNDSHKHTEDRMPGNNQEQQTQTPAKKAGVKRQQKASGQRSTNVVAMHAEELPLLTQIGHTAAKDAVHVAAGVGFVAICRYGFGIGLGV